MYELRTAISYLIPHRGQLSISVVGLIAVLVIQAITWLILVFFSTTEGFESRWSQKIISVMGPIRVVPTPMYFDSPYNQLDLYSSANNYISQRFSQKIKSPTIAYDPSIDPPLPRNLDAWYTRHATTLHPINSLLESFDQDHLPYRLFESTICHLAIPQLESSPNHSLSQYTCLLGFEAINPQTFIAVSEISITEVEHLLLLLTTGTPQTVMVLKPMICALNAFEIVTSQDIDIQDTHIPQGTRLKALITFFENKPQLILSKYGTKTLCLPLDHKPLPFSVITASISQPPLVLPNNNTMPFVPSLGYPAFLPKQMRQQGARLLDTGTFQFAGAEIENAEPLSLPFYIAGFFDSGILPIGGKLVITSLQAVTAIQPYLIPQGPIATSGIIIDVPPAQSIRSAYTMVQQAIDTTAPGLFIGERYDQYEVTSDLYQQLASEKTLFRLLSIIILVVACSNIFSMLFILAHDRRKEIAILRALGASTASITAIFLLAGLGVGLMGSSLGACLATITLHYLPELLALIGVLQGHAVLQQAIYGDVAAQSLHLSTLLFTFGAISCISAVAGALAAVRACKTNVSEALRS